MASQLMNKICCVKNCWGVYEQNSTVNTVRVDDMTIEWAIIANEDEWNAGNLVWFDVS